MKLQNLLLILAIILAIVLSSARASELVYQFKNPSFSGVNTGAQWLTIENQEFSRRKAIQDKIEADLKAKEVTRKISARDFKNRKLLLDRDENYEEEEKCCPYNQEEEK